MTITADLLGRRLVFEAAPGLFSAGRIDDGTRLLLSYLPASEPKTVLDLGCGYGGLGLPVAASHPQAQMRLVDRDLVAVDASRRNAATNALGNVTTHGSLGYRDVGSATFDWILCNVPARIGQTAIEYLLGAGAARLTPTGELRIVVIRDLEPIVQEIATNRGWAVEHVTSSARHGVFRLAGPMAYETDHESLYLRDTVTFDALQLERPHDISEDPGHLREGLPLLLECLPRQSKRALVWRGGYGVAAIALARRGAMVTTVDRDLLATTYARRNAARHSVHVVTSDVLSPADLSASERFDTVIGELSPPAGIERNQAEIDACLSRTSPGATVLWLGLARTMREMRVSPLATRGAYSVARLSARR